MKQKRILSLCLLLAFLVTALCGCVSSSDTPTSTEDSLSSGESSSDTTETTQESTDSSTESVQQTISLVGVWSGVRRDGDELMVSYFEFSEDGTGHSYGICYFNAQISPFPDAEADEGGWYVAPMGSPYDFFTYSLENGVLSLTYTGSEFEDYGDPITQTHTLQVLDTDTISLNDIFGTYTRKDLTLKELCALMDVDYTVH